LNTTGNLNCKRYGQYKSNVNFPALLEAHLKGLKPGLDFTKEFLWSDNLALSAARYLKDMEGCSLYPD